VINALTDGAHPCQILADLQTAREVRGTLKGRYAWIGDGNNVASSWIEAASLLGLELVVATPKGFEPRGVVPQSGGRIRMTNDPADAVRGADVVITDLWASMGQEGEAAKRVEAFRGFSVTPELMRAANKGAIVLHCLPAHRGEEIDASFLAPADAPIWAEAENRLHTQKALLEHLVR
jgi:ornithine carbamoyltransferase